MRVNFKRDWREDNSGHGFVVATDPTLSVFYGYHDLLGSLTRAAVEHLCLGYFDPQFEIYNAQCLHNGTMVVDAGLIFDRLILELIYTEPIESQADYA